MIKADDKIHGESCSCSYPLGILIVNCEHIITVGVEVVVVVVIVMIILGCCSIPVVVAWKLKYVYYCVHEETMTAFLIDVTRGTCEVTPRQLGGSELQLAGPTSKSAELHNIITGVRYNNWDECSSNITL